MYIESRKLVDMDLFAGKEQRHREGDVKARDAVWKAVATSQRMPDAPRGWN